MNTLTAQSAKEILEGMTNTPWTYMDGKTLLHIESSCEAKISGVAIVSIPLKKRADADAIIDAVNGTYGKNLDPEKYEQVVKAAEKFQKWLKEFDVKGLNDAELSLLVALEVKFEEEVTAALQAAKIK